MYDFGFVALDILYTFPEDTGVYMCKATNKYGSDVNQVQLRCLGTSLAQSVIATAVVSVSFAVSTL